MALIRTADNSDSILSDQFGVTYHSIFGAVRESNHVFIQAGLLSKTAATEIAVLEAGFGTGLNAFMTWLTAESFGFYVRYLGLEAYPLSLALAEQLNYPAALGVPGRQDDFLKLHALPWSTPVSLSERFSFEKQKTLIESFKAENQYDVIFFDAFAPDIQPELWTETVMRNMFEALRPGGVLVTYCVKGTFRRHLKLAGFTIEKLPGPPGKWEITRATRPASASTV